jgi:hypothetical protein
VPASVVQSVSASSRVTVALQFLLDVHTPLKQPDVSRRVSIVCRRQDLDTYATSRRQKYRVAELHNVAATVYMLLCPAVQAPVGSQRISLVPKSALPRLHPYMLVPSQHWHNYY